MQPLWVKELTDKPNGHGDGLSKSLAIHGNSLIIRNFDGIDEFVWFEAANGKEKWVFKEARRQDTYIYNDRGMVNENSVSFGDVEFFQLDLQSGTPNFYFTRNDGIGGGAFEGFTRIGDTFYVIRAFEQREDGLLSSVIYTIDDNTKNLSYFLEPQYPKFHKVSPFNGLVGDIRNVKAYQYQNKDYLVMAINDYGSGKSDNYLAIYNLSESKWEFEAITVSLNSDLNAGTSLEVYNGKVYLNNEEEIHCYDLLSGELVWKQHFDGNFQFSGFAIGDSMLIGNTNEATTYGVNPETGQIMWQVKSGGTTSPIAFMNGVAYFSGGSDGRLNAIDVTTGRYIWKLKRPGSSNWKRHVAVVPGDGKRPDYIVASTYKEYMAFPAAR
jgi:outer membrane protein assembly factor BamB